jgi:phosphoglycolate phosphatase
MKHYQLLIFDWDGTLVDSAGEIVGTMQQAIQDLGLPERTPAQIRELIGLGFHDVLARLFPDLETWRVRVRLAHYRSRYAAPRSPAGLFVSVEETLATLVARGFDLAVATGKSRRGLDSALARTGTADYFKITRCADESVPKPAPDLIQDILLRTATPPANALMIGDTEYDMAMARAAGVDALGVRCGVHNVDRLRAAGAMDVLDSVALLPDWLARKARPPVMQTCEE